MSNKHPRSVSERIRGVAADPAELFIAAVAVSATIYFIIYLIIGDGRFTDMFFIRCADFFMDFFIILHLCGFNSFCTKSKK